MSPRRAEVHGGTQDGVITPARTRPKLMQEKQL